MSDVRRNDERLRPWTIRESVYRIDEPFLRIRSDRVELPDGAIIESYYVRESRGFAIVAALTPDRDIVLVRQYKHGIGRITLELPAGMIDADEEPEACAIRELAEETGYAGDPPRLLRSLFADPTSSNGSFHVYLIENATPQFAQQLDPTEAIVIETATIPAFTRMVRDGTIASGSQLAAAYIALDAVLGDA
jgi:8-oxo-dGTP pyrophosphatase MutT (NUDIX family)